MAYLSNQNVGRSIAWLLGVSLLLELQVMLYGAFWDLERVEVYRESGPGRRYLDGTNTRSSAGRQDFAPKSFLAVLAQEVRDSKMAMLRPSPFYPLKSIALIVQSSLPPPFLIIR
jgi:hypothetical protein